MTDRYARLEALAEPLQSLDFEDKATLAHLLGLSVACCPGCGCWIGKPACHEPRMADRILEATQEIAGGSCEGCPDMEGDEDEEE